MVPVVAHRDICRIRATCPELGIEQKRLAYGHGDAIGPFDIGRSQPTSSWHEVYLATRCFVGAMAAGADGEMVNVSQVFHPDGRLAAPNSPYPLRPREPCMSA